MLEKWVENAYKYVQNYQPLMPLIRCNELAILIAASASLANLHHKDM